jgi:hypothetical protein
LANTQSTPPNAGAAGGQAGQTSSNNAATPTGSSTPALQAQAGGATADQPAAPAAAEGNVTITNFDKLAEWVTFAAVNQAGQEIGHQVVDALSGDGGEPQRILIVNLPVDYSQLFVVGQLHDELQRYAKLIAVGDAELGDLVNALQSQPPIQAAIFAENAQVKEIAGEESQGVSDQAIVPASAAMASLAGLVLAGFGGLPAAAAALPGITAGIGAVVSLAATTLAYLRADYTVTGATVQVSEQALRVAVAGALAASRDKARVSMLELAGVANAAVLRDFDATALANLQMKSMATALKYLVDQLEGDATNLTNWRDALREARWGRKPASPPVQPPVGQAGNGETSQQRQQGRESCQPRRDVKWCRDAGGVGGRSSY